MLFEDMRSGVAVPLLVGGEGEQGNDELLGVLLLESARLAAFDRQDVELLEALAQEAVIAIQNATQHERLQLMHQSLKDEQARRVAAETWTVMGQAATALAHRINNLIGIVPASAGEIRRFLTGIELSRADRDWVNANLDRIERNSRFVLRLSDALFRPFQESGPVSRYSISRMLNEALQAANLPSNVEVEKDYAPHLPTVESNSLLVDTFLELFANAGKAMEGRKRQRLFVRTHVDEGDTQPWVVVQVSDTGRGIAAEQMDHLWDMFKQSEDGIGFGLWWVRTFIEQQGGTIACQSLLNEGTTFTVRLPAGPSGLA
jgi:signal transduction histidine kinase